MSATFYYLLPDLKKFSDRRGQRKLDKRISLAKRSIFNDRFDEIKPLFRAEKGFNRDDFARDYHTSDEAIQNYIIATQNFGNEIQDSIDSIFEKPSSRYSNNIAARNTILRHQSDLLLDKKEDSLKYGRVPQGLLLSDKKKFSATNPVLFKQLNLSSEKLDEDIKKVLENKDNETVARRD